MALCLSSLTYTLKDSRDCPRRRRWAKRQLSRLARRQQHKLWLAEFSEFSEFSETLERGKLLEPVWGDNLDELDDLESYQSYWAQKHHEELDWVL